MNKLLLISPRSFIPAVCAIATAAVAALPATSMAQTAPSNQAQKIAQYREKLAEYNKARAAYEVVAGPYWDEIARKRTLRRAKQQRKEKTTPADYVLAQPPVYSGPPKPEDPEKKAPRDIPVVEDFLRNAKEHFGFTPERPANDEQYRHAYAQLALAAGLTPEQAVKIYAFESTGNGSYDIQAGLEYGLPTERAISTALGYNQLLGANSVGLLAKNGDKFVAALRAKANAADGERKERLLKKIATLKKMIAFTRTVPDEWSAHVKLAETPKGQGIHALVLDIDISPLMQVEKLLTSLNYAKRMGYTKSLSAAELEMFNLTGDGNGFDMVSMPDAMKKKIPTANFFQRHGFERNLIAVQNNTVEKLIAATDAKMELEAKLDGAKALAAAFELHNQTR
ncbi:hypothetical protein [Hyphomicrobium sp.]|uniref:hypothetical protein n=1 Tax=Hyphomicrobium sp. TaxID=82 RepID=UPI002D7665A7|nr:hypothetical protein [Hyphomicrobium sp.]HET6387874.1 hypothetical protein [Hyphomicrobium sp.]